MSSGLTRYAWLSIAAALLTLGLKLAAWRMTGSVGLLSDALESLVNLGGAMMALWMLRIAAAPADQEHAYGHDKAEYFASGFEGMLIFVAGVAILWAALPRLLHPASLELPPPALVVAVLASLINLGVGLLLLRVGRRAGSVALQADARHLLTDVWTSAGILAGVIVVSLSGWTRLDPMIAIAVALHILWTGARLVREASQGLMDHAWPAPQLARMEQVLDRFRADGVSFHAVRTRMAAARHFASLHVLVPGEWTVQRGHDLLEQIEQALAQAVPRLTVFTHLEPVEDPASYQDQELSRHG